MIGNFGKIGDLLKNAGKIQEMVKEAQDKLAKLEVTGESGGGVVRVIINAQCYAKSVTLDPDILKEDPIVIQDLIAAAINDAAQKLQKEREKMMGGFGNLGGVDGL